jgi:energy-coupling factor transport system substrate-specific component
MTALKLNLRSRLAIGAVTLVGIGAFVWPLLLGFSAGTTDHNADAPWVFVLLVPLLLLVVAAELGDGMLDAKAIAMLGVLSGTAALLRPLTGGVTGVQLMFFLLIPSGRVMGPGFGFVMGNVAMFVSAALTGGGGPWLPFQMLAAGWIGLGAGLLPRARGNREPALLAVYAGVSAIGYGFVMNLWFWPFSASGTGVSASVAFVHGAPLGENLRRWIAFSLTTSLGFDIPRAIGNSVAVLLLGRPVLLALRRGARRASFGAAVTFTPAAPREGDPPRSMRRTLTP